MAGGGWVIDTPGVRSLHMKDLGQGSDMLFAEITELAPSCKFRNCTHDHEPGCAVLAAVAAGTRSRPSRPLAKATDRKSRLGRHAFPHAHWRKVLCIPVSNDVRSEETSKQTSTTGARRRHSVLIAGEAAPA